MSSRDSGIEETQQIHRLASELADIQNAFSELLGTQIANKTGSEKLRRLDMCRVLIQQMQEAIIIHTAVAEGDLH